MDLLRKVAFAIMLLSLPVGFGCEALSRKFRVETPQEAIITKAVKEKLSAEKAVNFTRVNVETNDTTVSLSGIVTSLEARQRAVKLAWEASGVKTVVNRLEVQP